MTIIHKPILGAEYKIADESGGRVQIIFQGNTNVPIISIKKEGEEEPTICYPTHMIVEEGRFPLLNDWEPERVAQLVEELREVRREMEARLPTSTPE